MKKLYILTLALLVSVFSFGQGSEDFTNSTATPSYGDGDFVGNNGVTWTFIASRDGNGDANDSGISLPALMLRKVDHESKVTSSAVAGGIADFSVKLYKGFTGGGDRQVELFVNGISYGVSEGFDDFDEHLFEVSGINVGGDVTIELRNIAAKQVIVDDITWTAFAGAAEPSLTITSPSEAESFNPEAGSSLDVAFVVNNFDVDVTSGDGDGHIHYKVDEGSTVMVYTTDPITLTDLGAGEHTVFMWLVDNSHVAIDPAVEASVTFTIADYTVVANLAELRAGTIGDYYQVTGEVVGTFAQTYRNQKWVQDDTAGIKIDDNDGVITTIYTGEDAIANIKGQLTEYNDLLQFVPTVDPGAPASSSPDNIVIPEVVTLAAIVADVTAYESELVLIMDATIADIESGDGTFQTGENYPFTDASGESILRTNFYGADYIGELLPAIVMDYVCIVGNYNGTAQVTPRDLNDMFHVGTVDQTIAGFGVYPNPTNGVLNITTQNNLEKNIQISDLLGKVVFQTTTSNTSINVADLNNGVYIIQVTEAGLVATRKLVVE